MLIKSKKARISKSDCKFAPVIDDILYDVNNYLYRAYIFAQYQLSFTYTYETRSTGKNEWVANIRVNNRSPRRAKLTIYRSANKYGPTISKCNFSVENSLDVYKARGIDNAINQNDRN